MLLLFSGGVESTSLLKWLLTTTDQPVTAVHIYCPNSVGRAHLEWGAVTRLEPKLQAIRPFVLHRVDMHFPFDVRDSEVQLSVLPALMRHLGERQFVKGLCLEDWKDEDGYRGPNMTPDTARARFGRRMAEAVQAYFEYDTRPLNDTLFRYRDWHEVSPFLPPMLWPKAQHIEHLGDLYPLTWSCLKPIGGVPCGQCGTCRLLPRHR